MAGGSPDHTFRVGTQKYGFWVTDNDDRTVCCLLNRWTGIGPHPWAQLHREGPSGPYIVAASVQEAESLVRAIVDSQPPD